MSKPCLIYDGNANLYQRWVAKWQQKSGDAVDYCTYQDVADQYPDISSEEFQQTIHLILPDGSISSGAKAIFRLMLYTGGRGLFLRLYQLLPVFAWLSEWLYRRIHNHQQLVYRITILLWGISYSHSYRLTRWLFLRLLGFIYCL